MCRNLKTKKKLFSTNKYYTQRIFVPWKIEQSVFDKNLMMISAYVSFAKHVVDKCVEVGHLRCGFSPYDLWTFWHAFFGKQIMILTLGFSFLGFHFPFLYYLSKYVLFRTLKSYLIPILNFKATKVMDIERVLLKWKITPTPSCKL